MITKLSCASISLAAGAALLLPPASVDLRPVSGEPPAAVATTAEQGAPKWKKADEPSTEQPMPGTNPKASVGFGVDPNGAQPDGDGFLGWIVQKVEVSVELCDCSPQGTGTNCSQEQITYYEFFPVSTAHTADGAVLDTFALQGSFGRPVGWLMVAGHAKFIPHDAFPVDEQHPVERFSEKTKSGPLEDAQGNPVTIGGGQWSSGEGVPASTEKPDGWDDNFGGKGADMPAHYLFVYWNTCSEASCETWVAADV